MAKHDDGASTGTVLLALGVNAFIAVAKAVGGALSGSSALLSEAAHSVADTMNEAFLLTALKRSDRPADEQHPFGYGKERFFWSLIAAVGIFVAGAMFSFFEGYQELTNPGSGSEEGGFLTSYVVLAIALVAESASLTKAARQIRREARQAGHRIIEHIRTSDDPTVKTVASEDSAAVAGIMIAFAGIGLHQVTGNPAYDGAAALLIGVLLSYVAYALGRDNRGLLIGEAADPRLREELADQLASYAEVDDVVELLTMRMGTRSVLVAVRLDLAEELDSNAVEACSTQIEHDLRTRHPEIQQVFLDATRTPRRGSRASA